MRETFNHNSTTALLVEGILDSFSTGILIYVVLVELINPMMTQVRLRMYSVCAGVEVGGWGIQLLQRLCIPRCIAPVLCCG